MSDKKSELLKIKSYEEFDKRREEFRDMEWDEELNNHFHAYILGVTEDRDKDGLIIEAFPKRQQ